MNESLKNASVIMATLAMRMKTERMLYITLNRMVKGETRGRPVKRWLDGIKNDIKKLNLIVAEASRKTQSRES